VTAWARIRSPGAWTQGTTLKPSEAEQIDGNLAKAPNFAEGGAYSPSSAVDIGGSSKLKVDAPVVARDVANRAFVEEAVGLSPRLGDQVLAVGHYAAVHDPAIGALHVASTANISSTYGRAGLARGMAGFIATDPARVSIALDPATSAVLYGRGTVAPTDENKLYYSASRGASWADVGAGVLASDTDPVFVWWTGNEFLTAHDESSAMQLRTYDGVALTFVDAIFSSGTSRVVEMAFSPTTAVAVQQAFGSVYSAALADLTNWTGATALPANVLAYDIIYSTALELFVLCGRDTTAGPCLLTSPNGVTWTPVSITDPWPIASTNGILTSVCEATHGLVGVFYSGNDFTDPDGGGSHLGLSDDGGATWTMFDSLPGIVEKVRPAPTGIFAIGHAESDIGLFISG
jgi:hypothetical protein